MEWIEVTESNKLPRQTKEFLTKNMLQMGVLQLISWNNVHKHFRNKGKYVAEVNAGTHYFIIDV